MVALILGVLKVIGITLLIVLGLVLTIVAIVLFVPIRYQGEGQITDDKKEANVQVTWLLKAVRIKLDYLYPKKPILSVKVLWIDIMKLLENKKQKKQKPIKKKQKKADAKQTEESQDWEVLTDQDIEQMKEPVAGPEQIQQDQDALESSVAEEVEGGALSKEKIPFRQKIENIIFKITSIYDKIKKIIENIEYYVGVLQEEDTKQLLKQAWGAIVKILKSIRPSVFELKAEVGLAMPDATGKVYGAYCTVMPMLEEHVQITPNFEEQIIRGDLKIKGKITIFVIVVNALRIVFDRRLKPLINKLKNGGSKNGRE